MIYLKTFTLLDEEQEYNLARFRERRRIFNNQYPLQLFYVKEFQNIEFDNITIFYGGNGSGKTTLLNIIADKLLAERKSVIDKGSYFKLYVDECQFEMSSEEPIEVKVIASDDVFEYLLDIRAINSGVNKNKERLSKSYMEFKYNTSGTNFDTYEELKNSYESKHMTMSKFVRQRLGNNNLIEQSNGESALMFWEKEIQENSIYLLDEPENSLSAENQLKLKQFIEESARFYNCQFIISTHSPFLLNLKGAKIYDLDDVPVKVKNWTKLANVKVYYDFFKEHENEFKD